MKISELSNDGVAVFPQLLSSASIAFINNELSNVRRTVMSKISGMQRPLRTYSDIAEREPGRLDYRCGFTDKKFIEIAQPIVDIVHKASPDVDFRHYWGAIPSLGGSGPTPMHRDVYPIVKNMPYRDLHPLNIQLPPYYFTVLIPLMQITEELGPTRFIKGSHQHAEFDITTAEIYSPLLSPGDVVIFDGRILHQGSANKTTEERIVAYITFVANWYHDQTFVINEYLFPELSMPGR